MKSVIKKSGLPGGEGLSDYGARWYDAKLGRFLSADTIVPRPSNPQALNRYAYTFNNPLNLADPSGHEPIHHSNYPCSYTACVKDTLAGKWVPVPTWTPALHQRYYGSTRKSNSVAKDPFDYLSTYVGVQLGVGGTGNILVGGEMDFDVAGGCNVISLECSMFLVNAAGVRTATPELAAVNIHGGYTLAYHASSKASMLDAATFNSVDAQSDEIARVGISVSRSRGYNSQDVNNDGKFAFLGVQRSEPLTDPFIDPLFKHTVDATSVNLSLGVNVIPNTVDIGYVGGVSDTNEIGSVNLINLFLTFLKGSAFPIR